MRTIIQIALLCTVLHQTFGYSKYGRSCKDIGCPSTEMCVMAEDPCSYYNRDQCGSYPTCKASSGASSSPSCATHICPPTQECQLDNGTPKCVASRSSSTHVHKNENTGGASAPSYPAQNPSYPAQNPSYPAQNPSYPAQNPSYPAQNPSYPAQNPSYPSQPNAPSYPSGGGLYPSLTTARPNHGGSSYPGYPSQSGGYPGGAPNSGYPGYPNNRGGYPSQGYPQYPAQGYPQYPQSGYPNQGQPQYPGYQNNNNRQGYGGGSSSNSNSGSNPIVDKITEQLKTIGAGILKNALTNALSGGGNRQ